MRAILFAVMVFGLGCGGGDPLTKGDVSQDLSEAYCARLVSCDWMDADKEARCVVHNYSHFCELDATCNQVMPDLADGLLEDCLEGFEQQNCLDVAFGVIPQACIPLF